MGSSVLRSYERIIAAYFLFLAGLGTARSIGFSKVVLLLAAAILVWLLSKVWSRFDHRWLWIAREWASLAFILPAYWSTELFVQPYATRWNQTWLHWDQALLNAGLRRAIESCGSLIPSLLEMVYLLLYLIPHTALAAVHLSGDRRRASRMLDVLFLGTLTVYALLPVVPVEAPRLAFPGQDVPLTQGFPRSANLWLLDHLDISTSVFPSGHVAVAFSCAFGLIAAVRHRKLFWGSALLAACLVYLATIYGRYHYAIDGLVSISIAAVAGRIASRTWDRDAGAASR